LPTDGEKERYRGMLREVEAQIARDERESLGVEAREAAGSTSAKAAPPARPAAAFPGRVGVSFDVGNIGEDEGQAEERVGLAVANKRGEEACREYWRSMKGRSGPGERRCYRLMCEVSLEDQERASGSGGAAPVALGAAGPVVLGTAMQGNLGAPAVMTPLAPGSGGGRLPVSPLGPPGVVVSQATQDKDAFNNPVPEFYCRAGCMDKDRSPPVPEAEWSWLRAQAGWEDTVAWCRDTNHGRTMGPPFCYGMLPTSTPEWMAFRCYLCNREATDEHVMHSGHLQRLREPLAYTYELDKLGDEGKIRLSHIKRWMDDPTLGTGPHALDWTLSNDPVRKAEALRRREAGVQVQGWCRLGVDYGGRGPPWGGPPTEGTPEAALAEHGSGWDRIRDAVLDHAQGLLGLALLAVVLGPRAAVVERGAAFAALLGTAVVRWAPGAHDGRQEEWRWVQDPPVLALKDGPAAELEAQCIKVKLLTAEVKRLERAARVRACEDRILARADDRARRGTAEPFGEVGPMGPAWWPCALLDQGAPMDPLGRHYAAAEMNREYRVVQWMPLPGLSFGLKGRPLTWADAAEDRQAREVRGVEKRVIRDLVGLQGLEDLRWEWLGVPRRPPGMPSRGPGAVVSTPAEATEPESEAPSTGCDEWYLRTWFGSGGGGRSVRDGPARSEGEATTRGGEGEAASDAASQVGLPDWSGWLDSQ